MLVYKSDEPCKLIEIVSGDIVIQLSQNYIIVIQSALPSTFFIFSSKMICPRPISMLPNTMLVFIASVELLLWPCDPKFKDTVSRAGLRKAWSIHFQNNHHFQLRSFLNIPEMGLAGKKRGGIGVHYC